MQIFISASSSSIEFRNAIENLIDAEYRGRHTHIFIPFDPVVPEDETLLNRIKSGIVGSHLILMDVTPKQVNGDGENQEWVTNEGVLIEYGIIVGLAWLHKLCVFCEESVSRTHVHPAFHKPIEQYSNNNTEQLKEHLRIVIRERERNIEDLAIRTEINAIPQNTSGTISVSGDHTPTGSQT